MNHDGPALTTPQFATLPPRHKAQIDSVAAIVADRLGHRNTAILTAWANIRIKQHFATLSERGAAILTGVILELEVPDSPALRAVIVGNNLDFAIN